MLRRTPRVVRGIIPICDPFPHVSRHVIRPIGTFAAFVTPDRSGREIAILHRTVSTLEATPSITEVQACAIELIPPEPGTPIRPAGRFFPLCLCGETFASPRAIGLGIFPTHLPGR